MKTSDINNLGNAYRSIYEAKTKEEVSDNKEFVPHMMYDPETGEGHKAEKPEDHERMKKLGYTHDEPTMVKEKKLPRQMLDPKKDVMVVKNNKVLVVDKSKEKEYLKKGWGLAEQIEEAVSPEQQAAIAISKKEKEEMKNEEVQEGYSSADRPTSNRKIKRPKQGDYKNYIDLRPSKLNAPGGRDKVKYTKEGSVKDLAMKIDKVVAKMSKNSKLKPFAKKFASMAMNTMDIEKSLEKALPSSVSGAVMIGLLEGKTKSEDASQFVAAARQAKKEGKDTFIFADKEYPVTCKEVEEAEKKLDPVDDKANDKKFKDRKDKDIDNDGDVDDSDEYLHNRRAKVDDAIDGGKKPAKKEEDEKKKVAKSPKTAEIEKIGEDFVAMLEAELLEKAEPEGIVDKESPKSKEFIAKHKKSDKKIEDKEEEAEEATPKAGKATKEKSGKRAIDSTVGDKEIVKSTEAPIKEAKQMTLVDMARAHLAGQKVDFSKGETVKEKNPYDGRMKLAKEFMQRMDKRKGIKND